MAGQRLLIVSVGMGAGHNQVAAELARRWRADDDHIRIVDLLQALSWPVGRLLRGGYGSMLAHAPWLYEDLYRIFLTPHPRWQPGIGPLSWLIGRTLRPVITQFRPTAVVSTIHIGGQGVGRLRVRGRLGCPAVVVITEAVPHRIGQDREDREHDCQHGTSRASAAASRSPQRDRVCGFTIGILGAVRHTPGP